MKTFNVYFDQVNQTRYEIQAKNEDEAISKAVRQWIAENGKPFGAHVEERSQ